MKSKSENRNPKQTEQTQLSGGSNGKKITENDYIGTFDNGTGVRTGLKLLELAGKQITDFAYIGFSSEKADKALYAFAEKYNNMAYCGTNELKAESTGEKVIAYRKKYDTDFCEMIIGNYYANTGAVISEACLSAVVHATGNIEDSGLALECTWISGSDEEFDFDQLSFLYQNQIACFTLKPSETMQGSLGWRMGNDYTLAITVGDLTLATDIKTAVAIAEIDGTKQKIPTSLSEVYELASEFTYEEWDELKVALHKDNKEIEEKAKNLRNSIGSDNALM